MAILSYLGRVNLAVRLVTEKYPGAKLYEVEGTCSQGPSTKWQDVDELRVVFLADNMATAIIDSEGWGEFGPIKYVKKPWLQDVIIQWPVTLELSTAVQLMQEAGYRDPFGGVTLRHPLYPGVKQPYYIFGFGGGKYVFVGVFDHKVSTHT